MPHWQVVANLHELERAGAWRRVEIDGDSVLLVHDGSRVRAFYNVCQHRGRPLKDERAGHCDRIVCPLHGWTYRLDGTLETVPDADTFPFLDLDRLPLSELACRVTKGAIEVATRAAAASGGDGSARPASR